MGAGCGLRQGEVFGLAVDDIDFKGGWVRVRRQVKRVRSCLVFGLPKNDKERRVPLSRTVAWALREHLRQVPAIEVTLPWEEPAGELVTVRLMFTSGRDNALNRATFNRRNWHPALRKVGIEQSRATGFHALRHFYASTLLDGGENIKALALYLGHANPAFTLRVYTHLMEASEERTRQAIDAAFCKIHPGADGPATAPEVA